MDIRRHMELFNPDEFKTKINIIGAGATGSWIALFLAKLGIEGIAIWDFDKVEEHNIPNQLYGKDDVGKYKVDALQSTIEKDTGIKIDIVNKKYTEKKLFGIVILQVDSMSERKRIFENSISMNTQCKLMIDSRMGLDMSRIYNVCPTDTKHLERYINTLYDDTETEVSACGASMTVITSAVNIASTVVRQIIQFHNDGNLDNAILTDFINNQTIAHKW